MYVKVKKTVFSARKNVELYLKNVFKNLIGMLKKNVDIFLNGRASFTPKKNDDCFLFSVQALENCNSSTPKPSFLFYNLEIRSLQVNNKRRHINKGLCAS